MRNLLSSRFLVIAVILIVGIMLLGQNVGIADSHASVKTSAPDSTLATPAPPQMDWALAVLLLGGALIPLLRPRRRKVVTVTAK